jgi:multisubunit Na+/H+ antiporter MnhB subunit
MDKEITQLFQKLESNNYLLEQTVPDTSSKNKVSIEVFYVIGFVVGIGLIMVVKKYIVTQSRSEQESYE